MEKSFFKNLVSSNYFDKKDKDLIEIGNKTLDLLFFNVSCRRKMKEAYQEIGPNYAQIIIENISISNVDHLKMCIGSLCQERKFSDLQKMEKQIERIMSSKSSSISHAKSSYINHSSQFSICKPSSISFQSQLQRKMENFSHLFSRLNDQNQEEEENEHFGLNQLSISDIQQQNPSRLNGKVDTYLNTIISYNAELSLLQQKFKFKSEEWKRTVQGQMMILQSTLNISNAYSGCRKRSFLGRGRDKNTKNAKEKASKQMLQGVYSEIPHVMQEMQIIKKNEGIKT